jgi:hypothetical protein
MKYTTYIYMCTTTTFCRNRWCVYTCTYTHTQIYIYVHVQGCSVYIVIKVECDKEIFTSPKKKKNSLDAVIPRCLL